MKKVLFIFMFVLSLSSFGAGLNVFFYPIGFPLEWFQGGIETPIIGSFAAELEVAVFEFDDWKYSNLGVTLRKYADEERKGGFVGLMGKTRVLEYVDKDDEYSNDIKATENIIALELGYKMQFVDFFYMSNGFLFGYLVADMEADEAYDDDEERNSRFYFSFDLMKIHIGF